MNYAQRAKSFRIFRPFALVTLVLILIGTAIPASAETPTDLYNFKGGTGDVANTQPYGVMVQGRDGNLYSAAPNGGANGDGGIFMVTPSGAESVIYSFKSSDGSSCQQGLNLANDGNFYGHCISGGSNGNGIVYKVTPSGTFAILHAFTGGADGGTPNGPPIQAADGNLYATTWLGGAHGQGTVYKLTLGGTLTTLYSFTGGTDGGQPSAPFVQGSDGYLYGSTQFAGANSFGTIFKISTAGKLKVLHAFTGADGNRPVAAMTQGTDGKFYGSTYQGGANNNGVVFRMTAAGALTVLHSFVAATDGGNPEVALVQATDGNFYGLGLFGGNAGGWLNMGQGSIYKVTATGAFSTLYLFDGTVGSNPGGALVQNTNGLLYGDTYTGSGAESNGIFYSWSIGAKPFAKLAATSGIEGTSIGIFGQGFSSATGVTFGGVSAAFTIVSDNFLTATVPPGALTGLVVVKIPSGNLSSSVAFKVTPTLASFSPTSGPVGTPVVIMGTGLIQTTSVTFGGVKATTVIKNSDTQVTADVPTGAKTGKIGITTKGGKVTSKTSFTVN